MSESLTRTMNLCFCGQNMYDVPKDHLSFYPLIGTKASDTNATFENGSLAFIVIYQHGSAMVNSFTLKHS